MTEDHGVLAVEMAVANGIWPLQEQRIPAWLGKLVALSACGKEIVRRSFVEMLGKKRSDRKFLPILSVSCARD